jgi:hypothetical protein
MSEHPIIFSGPMVRAILEGRKTQTRRVITSVRALDNLKHGGNPYPCPYGQRGDLLWVRENWAVRLDQDDVKIHDLPHRSVGYWADGPGKCCNTGCAGAAGKVRPSIYMPRWASRLTLRITAVRVQRVREIGRDGREAKDIYAEGITDEQIDLWRKYLHPDDAPAHTYSILWDSINAKRGYSWKSNPWVWALTFERVNT